MPKIMFAATRKTKVKIRIVIRAITAIYPNLIMALTIVKYLYYKRFKTFSCYIKKKWIEIEDAKKIPFLNCGRVHDQNMPFFVDKKCQIESAWSEYAFFVE